MAMTGEKRRFSFVLHRSFSHCIFVIFSSLCHLVMYYCSFLCKPSVNLDQWCCFTCTELHVDHSDQRSFEMILTLAKNVDTLGLKHIFTLSPIFLSLDMLTQGFRPLFCLFNIFPLELSQNRKEHLPIMSAWSNVKLQLTIILSLCLNNVRK